MIYYCYLEPPNDYPMKSFSFVSDIAILPQDVIEYKGEKYSVIGRLLRVGPGDRTQNEVYMKVLKLK